MAKIRTQIELNEEDLRKLIAKEYDLDLQDLILTVNHYNGDQSERQSTTIIINGRPNSIYKTQINC